MISKCTTGALMVLLSSSVFLVAALRRLRKRNAKCAVSAEDYSFRRRSGLVQKRQLLLPLHDFGGCLSDEARERSREVGLVEIIETANHIKNGNSFLEQDGCSSGALDLSKRCVGDAR